MHHLRRIAGAAAFFAFAVLWSNVWGLLRDVLNFRLFREQAVAAYTHAALVPAQLPSIIAIALSAAMVPVLVDLCKHGRSDEARRVAAGVLMGTAVVLGAVSLAGIAFADLIVRMVDPQPAFWPLASRLCRVLFPIVLISGLSSVMASTLQSFERFIPMAFGQLLPNLIIVSAMLLLHHQAGIDSQAGGVVLGGAGYLAVVAFFYYQLQHSEGRLIRPVDVWWKSPAVRGIALALIPLLLVGFADWGATSLAVQQAAASVDTGTGAAVTDFNAAFKVLQIPQGVFINALSLVLLPLLSRFVASRDPEGLGEAISAGIRMVLFAVAPAVMLLSMMSLPVINVLFRHGFLVQQQANVAAPLVPLMAPYVLLSSIAEVLILSLMALKRVWLLLLVQLASFGAAMLGCRAFAAHAGLEGVAAAVTLVTLLNLGLLIAALVRDVPLRAGREMPPFLLKLAVACSGMAAGLALTRALWERSGALISAGRNAEEIVSGVLVAAVLYAGIAQICRIPEWLLLRDGVLRFRLRSAKGAGVASLPND